MQGSTQRGASPHFRTRFRLRGRLQDVRFLFLFLRRLAGRESRIGKGQDRQASVRRERRSSL